MAKINQIQIIYKYLLSIYTRDLFIENDILFIEISLIQAINNVLHERHEIETNYKSLSLKLTKLQKEETERREQVIKKKNYLLFFSFSRKFIFFLEL